MSERNHYTEEASTLGWPVCHWPAYTYYDGRRYRLSSIETDADGDVTHAIYIADGGFQLTVFND